MNHDDDWKFDKKHNPVFTKKETTFILLITVIGLGFFLYLYYLILGKPLISFFISLGWFTKFLLSFSVIMILGIILLLVFIKTSPNRNKDK